MDKDDLIFGGDFFDLESEEDASTQKLELREGELREVAVLFADIRGFSSISNLFDAETIHKKMDEIMKIFTVCIVRIMMEMDVNEIFSKPDVILFQIYYFGQVDDPCLVAKLI